MTIKKLFIALILLTVLIDAEGQTPYEYIKIYTVQLSLEAEKKARFGYPNHQDSAKIWNDIGYKDILLAIQVMEKKGFELVTITTSSADLNTVTLAYMRRRVKK